MDKFEYRPATLNADIVKMDGPRGFVGTAENVRSREWAREFGKSNLMSAVRLAREVEVDFNADYETMDGLREAADADLHNLTPGTFVAQGEWKQRGYVLQSMPRGIHFGWVNTSLVIALLDGAWWRIRGKSLVPPSASAADRSYRQAAGEEVTAYGANGYAMRFASIYGVSVQSGTPTPDSPAPVQMVEPKNVLEYYGAGTLSTDADSNIVLNYSTANGNIAYGPIEPNTTYVLSVKQFTGANRRRIVLFDEEPVAGTYAPANYNSIFNNNTWSGDWEYSFDSGSYTWMVVLLSTSTVTTATNADAQLEKGSSKTDYAPPGCIGLNCGGVQTAIDLDGNVLHGLDDTYRDTIDIDSDGNVVLTKRTVEYDLANLPPNPKTTAYVIYPKWEFAQVYGSGGYRYYAYSYYFNNIADLAQSCLPLCTTAQGTANLEDSNYLGILQQAHPYDESIGNEILYGKGQDSSWHDPTGTAVFPLKETSWYTVNLGTITMPTVNANDVIKVIATVTPEISVEWPVAEHLNLDYPHDYPYNYTLPAVGGSIDTGRLVPCQPKITFYGPVTDPEITIAGNKYKVTGTLTSTDRLEADGREKTVLKIAGDGTVTNMFSAASRGSGAYIFEPIPPGSHEITWDTTFGVDVQWYDEVGEPPWSQS